MEAKAEKKRQKRRRRRIRDGKDPDKDTTDEDNDAIPEVSEKLEETQMEVSRSCDETRGAAVHYAPDYKYENLSQQLEWNKIANEKSREKVEDSRLSHPDMLNILEGLGFSKLDESGENGEKQPSFEFEEVDGEKLNFEVLSA